MPPICVLELFVILIVELSTVVESKSSENEILIDVQTDSSALLVLSEVYYAPGWKCDINGEPTKIFQTDHVLRSIYIPKGQHEVRFYYDHGSWKIARIVSRSSFLFLVCALFFLSWKDNKRVEI